MLSIQLPESLNRRLEQLAQLAGTTKEALVHDALLEYIGDLEDHLLADTRARKNSRAISLDVVEREVYR